MAVSDPQLCDNLDGIARKITTRFSAEQENLNALQKKRISTIDEAFKRKEKRLVGAYSQEENTRAKSFNQLEQKVQTDKQRETVKAFRTALDAALTKKRLAIATAIADFKDGLTKLATKRDGDIIQAVTQFKDAAAQAIASAKTDCTDNKDLDLIQTNLKQTLSDARQAFKDKQTKLQSHQDALHSLQTTFKDALRKTADDFTNTLQDARNTLEQAFPAQ